MGVTFGRANAGASPMIRRKVDDIISISQSGQPMHSNMQDLDIISRSQSVPSMQSYESQLSASQSTEWQESWACYFPKNSPSTDDPSSKLSGSSSSSSLAK